MTDHVVTLHAINFRGDAIEIVYSEESDNKTDFATMTRSVVFDATEFEKAVEFLIDNTVELLDAVLVAIRNPPKTYTAARARRTVETDDIDDPDGDR